MWKLIPKAGARHRIVQHAPRNSSCCSCILPTFYGHIYQAAKPFLGFCIRYTVCGNLHWLAGHVSPDAGQSSSHFSADISKQPAPWYPRLKTYYNNPFDMFDSTAIVSQSPPFSVDRCRWSGWSGFDDMEKMLMIHDDPFPNILNTVELFHYIHYTYLYNFIYHYSPLYITIIYYRYWLPLHITIAYYHYVFYRRSRRYLTAHDSTHPESPGQVGAIVGDMTAESQEFRTLWRRGASLERNLPSGKLTLLLKIAIYSGFSH